MVVEIFSFKVWILYLSNLLKNYLHFLKQLPIKYRYFHSLCCWEPGFVASGPFHYLKYVCHIFSSSRISSWHCLILCKPMKSQNYCTWESNVLLPGVKNTAKLPSTCEREMYSVVEFFNEVLLITLIPKFSVWNTLISYQTSIVTYIFHS